jgi:hypothetical protein
VNTRRVVYCLICAVILYSASAVASRYMDYSRYPLSKMFEEYSGFKANFQAGSNYNVGAAAALMVAIGKKGGRGVLPFLEEESFDPETHELIRSAAAEAYVDIADVEESAEFMRKLYEDPSMQGSGRYFLEALAKTLAYRCGTGILPVFHGRDAHATRGFARSSSQQKIPRKSRGGRKNTDARNKEKHRYVLVEDRSERGKFWRSQ